MRFAGLDFHRLRRTVKGVAVRSEDFGDNVCVRRKLGDVDDAIEIGRISAVAITDNCPRAVCDFESRAIQWLAGILVELFNHQRAGRVVVKGERLRVAIVDFDRLRNRVGHIPIRSFRLGHNYRCTGFDSCDVNLSGFVRGIDAVRCNCAAVRADKLAIGGCHGKLRTGKRFTGHAVELADDETTVTLVLECDCHHILLCAADIHRLWRIADYVAVRRFDLFNHICARLQAIDDNRAIRRRGVLPDHRAAAAACAGKIAHLKSRALQRRAGVSVYLANDKPRQRHIFECYCLVLAAADVDFLRGFDQRIPVRSGGFGDLVPAIAQIVQLDLTVFVSCV